MGLFDIIKHESRCQGCYKEIKGFQTKSFDCNMDQFKIGDRINIHDDYNDDEAHCYTSCYNCGCWNDRKMIIENGILLSIDEPQPIGVVCQSTYPTRAIQYNGNNGDEIKRFLNLIPNITMDTIEHDGMIEIIDQDGDEYPVSIGDWVVCFTPHNISILSDVYFAYRFKVL